MDGLKDSKRDLALSWEVAMKGTLIGVAVFVLLSLSVTIAAVGAVSQVFSDAATPAGVSGMAFSQYEGLTDKVETQDRGGAYQAFTYVCPFH